MNPRRLSLTSPSPSRVPQLERHEPLLELRSERRERDTQRSHPFERFDWIESPDTGFDLRDDSSIYAEGRREILLSHLCRKAGVSQHFEENGGVLF